MLDSKKWSGKFCIDFQYEWINLVIIYLFYRSFIRLGYADIRLEKVDDSFMMKIG